MPSIILHKRLICNVLCTSSKLDEPTSDVHSRDVVESECFIFKIDGMFRVAALATMDLRPRPENFNTETQMQARRQDFAAGRRKPQGGHIF